MDRWILSEISSQASLQVHPKEIPILSTSKMAKREHMIPLIHTIPVPSQLGAQCHCKIEEITKKKYSMSIQILFLQEGTLVDCILPPPPRHQIYSLADEIRWIVTELATCHIILDTKEIVDTLLTWFYDFDQDVKTKYRFAKKKKWRGT